MKLSHFFASAAAVVVLASPAKAQQVTLNFDDLGRCTGTPMASYASWIALASGVTCQTGNFSVISANSTDNYLRSAGNMDWSFLNGPVVFNGLYASGYGSFYMDLMSGGNVVFTRSFLAYGSNVFVGPNAFAGQVDRVRIRLQQGYGVLGVDDISFLGTQTSQPTPGDNTDGDPVDDLVNEPVANPEPVSMLLMATGLGGVGALARRRRKAAEQA
jgi:hypothetical protein